MNTITISEEQALWFRARRGFLAGPGAADAASVARALVGVQAQQEGPARLALSQRMAARPNVAALQAALTAVPEGLVHTWGQRDTLFFFELADWADVVAARDQWGPGRRLGPRPSLETLAACGEVVEAADALMTKGVVDGLVPESLLEGLLPYAEKAQMEPLRFATTRVMWALAQGGTVSLAGKRGAERLYGARTWLFPEMAWPQDPDPVQAAARLARRYLASYAPATPADIAQFFGARVREVRVWLEALMGELVTVECGDRKGLLALAADADALRETPGDEQDWPVRLLPLWDSLLMGHKDKSWLLPEPADGKRVWRPGAYVTATVHARGKIVATWKHEPRKRGLRVKVTPLSGWRASFAEAVAAEAQIVATHLELPEAAVTIT